MVLLLYNTSQSISLTACPSDLGHTKNVNFKNTTSDDTFKEEGLERNHSRWLRTFVYLPDFRHI